MYKQPLTLVKIVCFSLFIATTLVSCSQEDLLANVIEENAAEEEPDTEPDVQPIGDLDINTTPCDYTLDGIAAGTTLAIECRLDLDGKTVSLPTGVTLEYKGGEIINGTLNFTAGGKIDGNLLNQNLTVEGNVSLLSETFILHPSRWDLVQGETTSEIAQANNTNLEDLMFFTKSIGATTFTIDTFDAYFEVSKVTSTTTNQNFYPSVEAINIPSDFHLNMSEKTILRVLPNDRVNGGSLLAVRDVTNCKITGGTLYGDRDEHKYIAEAPGEQGNHLFTVHGANNIILDGIKMTMGSAGGLFINGINFTFQPNYIPSYNVTVKNCVFEKNRRMATAITDGYDILLENNKFIDTGIETEKSNGGNVAFAVNLEGVRKREDNGQLLYYERVYNVTLRNNSETGSRVGSFNIFTGENIIIENNNLESKVNYSFASGTKIRNNVFKAAINEEAKAPAITAGGSGETVYDNEISGNTITGYSVGISANHKLVNVFDNIIDNCTTGIQLKESTDMKIYGNVITNTKSFSRGIMAHIANVNNVKVYDNEINVVTNALYFVQLNKETYADAYSVDVYDNKIISGIPVFSNSKGIVFRENDLSVGLQLSNAYEIEINSNAIVSDKSHGISLLGENYEVDINNNKINYPTTGNFECIKIASTTSKSEISNLANNTCN